jgi:bifunctional DNA-binding transcriptional regulator/antitoxin component of YhaV-PrlF toxin-antitoxin module
MAAETKKYSFRAEIREGRGGGAYVEFPYDAQKEFGTKGRVPVNATIGGVSDRSALIRMGMPCHILGVPKAIREKIGKGPGDTVAITLWKDDVPRAVVVPAALKQAMKQAGVLGFFDGLSFTHRKEYCRWITEAKKEETREKRLDKAIRLLKKGVRTPG